MSCRFRLRGGIQSASSDGSDGRFVEDCPKETELLDGIDELLKINRFNDVGIDAEFVTPDEILFLTGGGEHYDRHGLQAIVCFDLPEHLHSVHLWHFQIEQHDGGVTLRPAAKFAAAIEKIEGLRAVPGYDDFIGQV